MEWSKPSCPGLWEPRVDAQTGEAPKTSVVGSEWTGPEEGQVP